MSDETNDVPVVKDTKAKIAAEKELFSNVIELGKHTRRELMRAIRTGEAPPEAFGQIRAMDENIKLLEAYQKQEEAKRK